MNRWILTAAVSSLTLAPAAALADSDTPEDLSERTLKAREVLISMAQAPDDAIPATLFRNAHAVAVIPNVVKGAFLVGGQWGKGLVAARNDDGEWGAPAFVQVHGGNFGLQVGVEATDLILVFTEPDGLREMLKDNLKLGVEAGAVAGPVGREASASSNYTFDSPIYAYSRNKGAFVGISLDGTLISIDDSANHEAYGAEVRGDEILVQHDVSANDLTRPFQSALESLMPEPAATQ